MQPGERRSGEAEQEEEEEEGRKVKFRQKAETMGLKSTFVNKARGQQRVAAFGQ